MYKMNKWEQCVNDTQPKSGVENIVCIPILILYTCESFKVIYLYSSTKLFIDKIYTLEKIDKISTSLLLTKNKHRTKKRTKLYS